jgi:hypothetical protein
MAPWQLGEALSEMAFPLNFDGFGKIVWRPMMRKRAAAAACIMMDWFVSIGLENDTMG